MIGDEFWIPPTTWSQSDLTLRIYKFLDAEQLAVAVNESYDHLKPWMPWATETQSLGQSELNICRFLGSYYSKADFTMGIWDGDTLVGGTGFHLRGRSVDTKNGEVGMWIRASYAGQGWGTRVLAAMLEWGFSEWGWERIFWQCDVTNIGSARVAEKCGLTHEGTFRSDAESVDGSRRDTHQYAILKSDWAKR